MKKLVLSSAAFIGLVLGAAGALWAEPYAFIANSNSKE